MKKFIKGIKWFAKFADVWALGLLAIGLYFLEPFIREHYDITTAEMGGSFYTTILYKWVLIVVASLSAYLALRFNYWNELVLTISNKTRAVNLTLGRIGLPLLKTLKDYGA